MEKERFAGFGMAWDIIPARTKLAIINAIQTIRRPGLTKLDEIANIILRGNGTYVMVSLAGVCFAADGIQNIHRWAKSDISGKECCKNVIDATCVAGAGIAGGLAGAALGAALVGGPVVALAGIVGGYLSASKMGKFSDSFTKRLFGLVREKALESAYRYLGVEMTATDAQVNTAFRQMSRIHHPDKGGRPEDFIYLRKCHTIIRQSRRH